jgi:hypothetical protein
VSVVFVCQARSVESFMLAADAEVTGALRFYLRPGEGAYPGRNGMLFCDADDLAVGMPRAWLLPALPRHEGSGVFEPREAVLPFCRNASVEPQPVLDWAF